MISYWPMEVPLGVNNPRHLFNTADRRVSKSVSKLVGRFYVCCDSVWENHKADLNGSRQQVAEVSPVERKRQVVGGGGSE